MRLEQRRLAAGLVCLSFGMSKSHCYMCAARATSREHVPPRNLFPEASESGGVDYRLNLVTVPSCDAHNSAKSKDDEFLMVSLAGIVGSNSIGYMHRLGKVDRAVLASANRLLDQVLLEKEEIHRVEVAENRFIDLVWGTPDIDRLYRCFEHMAYALHRHHFKKNFSGSVKVLPGYLREKDHNKRKLHREQTLIPESTDKLEKFFRAFAGAATPLLLLDYDGTLADFRIDRFEARPWAGVRKLLAQIQQQGLTRMAVITGRPPEEIAPLLGLEPRLEVWGLHGAARLSPDGHYDLDKTSPTAEQKLEELRTQLRRDALGGLFEDKPNAAVIHWRGHTPGKAS